MNPKYKYKFIAKAVVIKEKHFTLSHLSYAKTNNGSKLLLSVSISLLIFHSHRDRLPSVLSKVSHDWEHSLQSIGAPMQNIYR